MTIEESYELFESESNQLQNIIDKVENKSEKTIPDIIEVYYQIMKVSSLTQVLKQNFSVTSEHKHEELLNLIFKVQKQISEKFNASMHPMLLSHITTLIQNHTNNLKLLARNSDHKSKETIESEANLYKELRELMSTKEFIEQYQNGLTDD